MRTLIIPDIHNQVDRADAIIKHEPHDGVVFLGDYFDSYDEGIEYAQKTALWLKKSLSMKNRTHLIGNHDLSYISGGAFPCSGFNQLKNRAIWKVLTKEDFDKLKFHVWIDKYLCTHAGLSKEFYENFKTKGSSVYTFMSSGEAGAKLAIKNSSYHPFFHASQYRGGWDDYAGILWCDFEEFMPIRNTKQIFGHTNRDKVRIHGKNNYCIDTGLRDYIIIENGKVEVKSWQ